MILRDCWRDTRINTPGDFDSRRRTALERLARRYLRFSLFALLIAGYMPMTLARYVDSTPLIISFAAYLLICSAIDYYLYRHVQAIDVAEMPVGEVLERAMYCRKRHLQFVAALLPCAFTLLGWMAWCVSGNVYMLAGMATGAVLGLIVGTTVLRRFLADYRDLNPD